MLWDIHLLLRHLVRRHKCYHYNDKPEQNCELSFLVGSDEHFDKPFRELFLWAVLMLRKEMAIYFWGEAHEALNLALAATSIYWHLRNSTSIHADLILNKLVLLKSDFEQIAIEHLNICYSMNREKAVELIEHPNCYWGNMTALNIALSSNDLEFISSPCCQHSITQTWMGGLATVSWWKVNVALFNPFLIWTYLKFRNDKTTEKPPGFFNKARIFYTAPITKFFYDLYSYIAFLGIFSYVVLFEFYETVGFFEFLLHIWILALALEEVREIVTYPSERKLQKPREWFQEYFWNKVDAVCMVLSLVGVLLRTIQQVIGSNQLWVRVEDIHLVMTISCTLCSVRLFKSYMVSLSFGPKLVMIKRMLVEVVLFLLILFIFILSYGVASQALLKRNRQPFMGIFREVFYLPYWQLYGELNLDRLEDFYLNCSREESRCNESPNAWLVPIMLGVYMLLGNVLLINLLIAVFRTDDIKNSINEIKDAIHARAVSQAPIPFRRETAFLSTAPKPTLRSKPTPVQRGSSEENSLLYRELLCDEEPKDEEDDDDDDIPTMETEELRPKLSLVDQALNSRVSDENVNLLMDLKSDIANLESKLTTLELTMADMTHHLGTLSSKLNDIVKS
ncbi:transient receptor potential cation channel subfamily M member 1-like [Limulus polyphemus]|uniref:Transient receptor potential cation channel subfamily M member 1-like n=1 Tax=Limulus polyphemus TaxID=6850 RepID=A0ABM1TPP8_LIMPO|nr:transient receptor potential cation channel subfamily M member 1-like [Limulus polyphemus]